MCIYCGTKHYRKIYEHHHGTIPKDETGRSYHVHHKDGRRTNNSPDNLVALSIQEHYDIHYAQGDWAAAMKLASTMGKSKDEVAEIARLQGIEAYKNGTSVLYKINEQRRDNTVYKWKNRKTGEVLESTTYDLATRCGQKTGPFTRVINGEIQSFKGWMRADREYDRTVTHFKYGPTIYGWTNINTGDTIQATISEVAKICGSPSTYLSAITRGKRTIHKGWRLVKPETSE